MADLIQEARIPVYINEQQAKSALQSLTVEAEKWRKKMFEAMAGGDLVAMKEAEKELKKVNGQMNSIKREAFDVNKVLENIANSSSKDLKKAMQAINKEMDGLNRGSKEYNALAEKKAQINNEFKKINGTLKEEGSIMDKLVGGAKGLLPAFGFAAIAGGAAFAFDKVINATDALGTQWEASVNGMKEGLNEFWRTIATGDWSNFSERMKEAIRIGEEYINTLDDIDEKNRSMSIIEANARGKELELEEKLRNKTLSKEERLAAGQERIKLEEDLAEKRKSIAQEVFDNELKLTSAQTHLDKDRLMEVVSDMDSATKIRAKAYNDQLAEYEKMKRANVHSIGGGNAGGGTIVALEDTPEMIRLKQTLDATNQADKVYAEAIRATGRTTDEQLDKMVAAYVGVMNAQNSAKENTKRVVTQVNSLLAGQEENGQKIENKALKAKEENAKKAIEILDSANNERNAKITDQYITEGKSEEWFHDQQLAAEMAYLVQKKAILESFGQSTIDVDKQINQKRIEAKKEFNAALDELEKAAQKQSEENDKAEEELIEQRIKDGEKATETNIKLKEDEADREKQILEQRQDAYLQFAQMVGQSFGDLMADSEATFADYLKNVLLMSLEALHQFLIINRAKALIEAATEGAPINPWAVIKAMAKVAAMEMAYQAVKVALTSGGKKKGHAEGGYTAPGPKYQEAGIVHAGEYVIPQEGVQNAQIRPIIDIMEIARRNGSLARLDLRPVVASVGISNGYSSGGNTESSTISTSMSPVSNPFIAGRDPELIAALNNNTKAIAMLMKNGVQFPIFTFKKEFEEVSDLINQTGMPGFDKK